MVLEARRTRCKLGTRQYVQVYLCRTMQCFVLKHSVNQSLIISIIETSLHLTAENANLNEVPYSDLLDVNHFDKRPLNSYMWICFGIPPTLHSKQIRYYRGHCSHEFNFGISDRPPALPSMYHRATSRGTGGYRSRLTADEKCAGGCNTSMAAATHPLCHD